MAILKNVQSVTGTLSEFLAPTGAILPFGGTTAPAGWLLCDGSAVSRTTYNILYGVITTIYGAGDNLNTFNIPNLQQKFPIGKAPSGTASILGTSGGNIDHSHSGGTHTHDLSNHTHSLPAHFHGIGTGADINVTTSTKSSGAVTAGSSLSTHTHAATSKQFALTDYTAQVGTGSSFGTVNERASATAGPNNIAHVHGIDHTHASGEFSGRIGLVTGGADGNTALTSGSPNSDTTSSAGVVSTTTNNPPFLVINYIIKT